MVAIRSSSESRIVMSELPAFSGSHVYLVNRLSLQDSYRWRAVPRKRFSAPANYELRSASSLGYDGRDRGEPLLVIGIRFVAHLLSQLTRLPGHVLRSLTNGRPA